MKTIWLIETFDETAKKLANSVRNIGYHCITIDKPTFDIDDFYVTDHFPKNVEKECILFYGSLHLGRQVQQKKEWLPGIWLNVDNYKCSTYYSYLGKYLLNKPYIMTTLGEFERQKDYIYDYFFMIDKIFIRPDTGFKTFSGFVLDKDDFDDEIKNLNKLIDKHSIILISTRKKIHKEWRFVVGNKQVITGCQYMEDGELNEKEGYDNGAFELASEIAKKFQPDLVFTIDICKYGEFFPHEYQLLEINSFSCAGLYKCDTDKIAKHISKIGQNEWKEYHLNL